MLHFNNHFVAIARMPVEEQPGPLRELEAFAKQMPTLARLLGPAVTKVANAYHRNVAQLRCCLIMLAAERYRLAQGHWPAAIADLVPKYLPAVPLDPYDGAPLRLRLLKDGLVIYSVGDNRQDDGGQIRVEPGKTGPPLDWGYRLWDVPRRRQPPKPPSKDD